MPPGFAHGNIFTEETIIQYLCTGEYNKDCEAGISPFAEDIDWSLSDNEIVFSYLKLYSDPSQPAELFNITEKDENGLTVEEWKNNPNSKKFMIPSLPYKTWLLKK